MIPTTYDETFTADRQLFPRILHQGEGVHHRPLDLHVGEGLALDNVVGHLSLLCV